RLADVSLSYNLAMQSVERGDADAILEIPPDFERNLTKTGIAKVMISVNSVNGAKGGLGAQYLTNIANDFSADLQKETGNNVKLSVINSQFRFNPHLDYKVFMVPALMVMLLTMLCGFLPALNIVGEKEQGTIEQLNVTPVGKLAFILAKLIPYWIIGYIVLTTGLTLAAIVYGLAPAGSLATVYLYATIYVLVVSGLGLVISNYSGTMQEAMFVMFFFMMLLILTSGLFTPINSMPRGFQYATLLNPLRHFMEVMRAVYLKGSAMSSLLPQFFALIGFAAAFNGWAVLSYKKSS
ncbi:MAG: ABC transporter permease, partial [Bacteroidales bacterium]|nr:ABC transporter permease [Bacteroidales bacterium]